MYEDYVFYIQTGIDDSIYFFSWIYCGKYMDWFMVTLTTGAYGCRFCWVTAMFADYLANFSKMRRNQSENQLWKKEVSRHWIMKQQ